MILTAIVWLVVELLPRFRSNKWIGDSVKKMGIPLPGPQIRLWFVGVLILLGVSIVINSRTAAQQGDESCFPPDILSLLPVGGSLTIEFSFAGDLNSDHRNEIVLLSSKQGRNILGLETKHVFLDILECGKDDNWRNVLHKPLGDMANCGQSAEPVQLGMPGYQQILVKSVCGSGAYLDYWLIGYGERDRVGVLLSEEGLFQGSAVIQQGRLVVGSSDKAWNYSWNGKDFVAGTGGIVPVSNSVTINYWMQNGELRTDAPSNPIQLDVGQTLYLRRQAELDDADYSLRALLSDGRIGEFRFEGQYAVLAPSSTGQVTITLVPNGYDWERSIDIPIHIE
jgi:hypothetical protein